MIYTQKKKGSWFLTIGKCGKKKGGKLEDDGNKELMR